MEVSVATCNVIDIIEMTTFYWDSRENIRWNLYLKSIWGTIYEQVLFIDKIVDWNWKQAINLLNVTINTSNKSIE